MTQTLLKDLSFSTKVFDAAPIGMAISGLDGILLNVNDSFIATIGYSREELVGTSFTTITHPDDVEQNLERNAKVVSGELQTHRMEKRFINKNGEILHAILKVSTLKNADGENIFLLAQILDITDKTILISNLETSERRFREIFEEAAIPMAQSDPEGNIYDVNKAFCNLLEYSKAELIKMNVQNISHADDYSENKILTKKLVDENGSNYSMEKRYGTKSGRLIHAILKVSSFVDPASGDLNLLGQIVDITAQKNYEDLLQRNYDELKKVNTELDSFVYRASHDIRGPIASLKGLLPLLNHDQEEKQVIDGMSKSINMLDEVIRKLVAFSENSQNTIRNVKIDMRSLVEEALDMLGGLPYIQKIKINVNIDPSLEIEADVTRLRPIMNNLIMNSVSYIDMRKSSPKIDIECNAIKEILTLTVIDNGIGMSEKTLDRAQEMFYRGSERSTGSGLGLYLVKEIVDKLDGQMSIESKEGIGTKVEISLPYTF